MFGNTFDDTHNFTGSVKITGSLVIGETSTSIPLEIHTATPTGNTPSVKTVVQQQTGIVLTNFDVSHKVFTIPKANLIRFDYWTKNVVRNNGRGGLLVLTYDSTTDTVAAQDLANVFFNGNLYSGLYFEPTINGGNIELKIGLYDTYNDDTYTENITILLNATIITTA
jgi:hypothetical protein